MCTVEFRYSPLIADSNEFRLFHLKKGSGPSLQGELIHSQHASGIEKIPYEAVSYVWGCSEFADAIHTSKGLLQITLNLSLILRDLRSPEQDRTLWIDAICINQDDVVERGHQVQLMRDIYSGAFRVLFYACHPTPMTNIIMSSLEALQLKCSQGGWESEDDLHDHWISIQADLEKVYLWSVQYRQKAGLEYILRQPWFSRVWILQEVANAQDALVYCGEKSV
jgi:hypothetical protein